MAKITLDQLPGILEQYGEDIRREVEEEAKKVSDEAVRRLRKASPRGKGRNSGTYAKGWAVKQEEPGKFVIYGKHGTYQLAHLLEFGHAKRNGGRTSAIVHIKPVEDWASEEFLQRVERAIEKA